MKLMKIIHRNESRIKIDFAYNAVVVKKLREIHDARWSRTLNSWHIPYTKEAFEQLKSLFPDVEYQNTSTEHQTEQSNNRATLNEATQEADIRVSKLVLKKHKTSMEQSIDIKTPIRTEKQSEIKISFTTKRIFVQLPKATPIHNF